MNPVQYFLESFDFLDWWAWAVALAVADVFLPRLALVVPAAAAGIIGFVLFLFPQLDWPWQLGGFALLSAAGVVLRFRRRAQSREPPPPAAPAAQEEEHHGELS